MKESYGEGLATRTDPESCVASREGRDEALAGAPAGWGPRRESQGSKASMNERWKSDGSVVPGKSPNKESGAPPSAEEREGRDSAKGNPSQPIRHRTQSRASLQQALTRVRQAARKTGGCG